MKMKKMMGQWVAVMLLSGSLAPAVSAEDSMDDILEAASVLSRFGAKLEKSKKLSPKDKAILAALSNISIPQPKMFDKHSVLAAGVDADTNEPVVINTVSGAAVESCQEDLTPGKSCGLKLVKVPKEVRQALKIKKPLTGKVVNHHGKEVDANFFVNVMTVYEGSTCITFYIGGEEFTICY